jgi:hypothetical protein
VKDDILRSFWMLAVGVAVSYLQEWTTRYQASVSEALALDQLALAASPLADSVGAASGGIDEGHRARDQEQDEQEPSPSSPAAQVGATTATITHVRIGASLSMTWPHLSPHLSPECLLWFPAPASHDSGAHDAHTQNAGTATKQQQQQVQVQVQNKRAPPRPRTVLALVALATAAALFMWVRMPALAQSLLSVLLGRDDLSQPLPDLLDYDDIAAALYAHLNANRAFYEVLSWRSVQLTPVLLVIVDMFVSAYVLQSNHALPLLDPPQPPRARLLLPPPLAKEDGAGGRGGCKTTSTTSSKTTSTSSSTTSSSTQPQRSMPPLWVLFSLTCIAIRYLGYACFILVLVY